MQAISDTLKSMFPKSTAICSKKTAELTEAEQRERLQAACDRINADAGRLNVKDGIDCPECKNRGYFMEVRESDFFGVKMLTTATRKCRCMAKRISVARIRNSGLGDALKKCTFDTFKTDEAWQAMAKQKALDFVAKRGRFFYIGGQTGCGKTHLCTAMVGELMNAGLNSRYMLWQDSAAKLKASIMDAEAYEREMSKLKTVYVLYIDDFLKPISGNRPTDADIRLAYELINARYNADCITIISSERHASEIVEIDEAIGGRILEYANGFIVNIARKPGRNYRLRGMDEI